MYLYTYVPMYTYIGIPLPTHILPSYTYIHTHMYIGRYTIIPSHAKECIQYITTYTATTLYEGGNNS
jgi:hypothetical protein